MRGIHLGALAIASTVALVAIPHEASAQAMDDWQVHLANGSYVYELQLKTLRKTDVIFEHDRKSVLLPLSQIDELRRIHKSFKHGTGGARATFGGLAGADDDVVQLSQFSVAEKHDLLAKFLATLAEQPLASGDEAKRGLR